MNTPSPHYIELLLQTTDLPTIVPPVRYLTGASNAAVLAVAHTAAIGLMATSLSGYTAQLDRWPFWAADNGCFSQGKAFQLPTFLAWLDGIAAEQRDCALFVVAPDVIQNAQATLVRSLPVLPRIRALGYRAAFVAQNGLTVATTPWGEFDALFLGGDDTFKLGPDAWALVAEARRRGLQAHMGRVNSLKRLRIAQQMGCTSADGTYLKYGPTVNLTRLLGWLRTLESEHQLLSA